MSDSNLNHLIDKLQKKRDLSKLSKDDYVRLRNIRRARVGSELVSPPTTFKPKEHYDLRLPMQNQRSANLSPKMDETVNVFERETGGFLKRR